VIDWQINTMSISARSWAFLMVQKTTIALKRRIRMKVTSGKLVHDLRTTFLERIFKHYPDHKKLWTADEIQRELTTAMYEIAIEYLEKLELE
jgi:hypothetical protein